uniref:Uncharacterized protein n=1 Tax=Arundo donax TaxID=35708 RepID=A0A0A8YRA6_ARUDO
MHIYLVVCLLELAAYCRLRRCMPE